ncbi:MAG: hypothetical protein ABFD98_15690 [Syntrophobacteraceae bacterium]|nr:hypothetical protein [Desulfobacteraceae bacterium]
MDGAFTDLAIKLASGFGIPGIIFVVWYFSEKSHEKTLTAYREDTLRQQKVFQDGLAEVKRMYENNVELVRNYASLAGDQKDVLIMNAQGFTKLSDQVAGNQFCPMVRLKKQSSGREE